MVVELLKDNFFPRSLKMNRRLEMGRGDWKVRGECTVKMIVCKSCNLVLTAEFYRQPMQFI